MIDKIEIKVKGGDGGNGAISFRREKFVPFGGPDGGDGGDGGDVILRADLDISTLLQFRYKRLYRATDGGNGRGKKKHGKEGKDLVLGVPVGTVVWHKTSEDRQELVEDLEQPGQQIIIARGGKGGWGNIHFVSSTNQTPRIAQKGQGGEEKALVLELRLIADVGIVGYPNAGKSSLLAAASAAKPKIASYPFTTLEPVLGVVEIDRKRFVMGEIPGLIEGAHLGRGLGYDFLRHATRTKMLVHLIDGASTSPVENMARVNTELASFDPALAAKTQIVAINKIDLPEVQARLSEIKNAFRKIGITAFFVSAITGEGLPDLMAQAAKMLSQVEAKTEAERKVTVKTFRPRPRETGPRVHKEDSVFVIDVPELERIVAGTDITDVEARRQLQGELVRLGILRALARAGVKPGDKVRCGQFEWEW
ncbi:MAG: GTPase ObgE [Chloroflexi bacterium]|nr:GTPase ObgE [Chloroflexota bacterium]